MYQLWVVTSDFDPMYAILGLPKKQAQTGIVEKMALSGKCTASYPKEGGIHYGLLNDVRTVPVICRFVCVSTDRTTRD